MVNGLYAVGACVIFVAALLALARQDGRRWSIARTYAVLAVRRMRRHAISSVEAKRDDDIVAENDASLCGDDDEDEEEFPPP